MLHEKNTICWACMDMSWHLEHHLSASRRAESRSASRDTLAASDSSNCCMRSFTPVRACVRALICVCAHTRALERVSFSQSSENSLRLARQPNPWPFVCVCPCECKVNDTCVHAASMRWWRRRRTSQQAPRKKVIFPWTISFFACTIAKCILLPLPELLEHC